MSKSTRRQTQPGRVIGYDRVSSPQQVASRLGLESQERQILEYFDKEFRAKGYVFGGIFTDEAVSAFRRKRFLVRPGAAALDAQLQKGDVVVMGKMDRAFRNMYDYIRTIDDWADRGVELRVLNFPLIVAETPLMRSMVKMIGVMAAFFAEMESELRSERIRDINQVRRRVGRTLGISPLGYKNVGKPKARMLAPDVEQRRMMWWIYRAIESGQSYYDVQNYLVERRVMWRKKKTKKERSANRFGVDFTLEFYDWQRVKRMYRAMVRIIQQEGIEAVLKTVGEPESATLPAVHPA